MATEAKVRGIPYWKDAWDQNDIGFHKFEVNKMLEKHSSSLFKEGEKLKFFVPLCGKTLDMKWLLDQGQTVVGLDGVKKALEEFCKDHNLEATEEDASALGQGCQMLKVKDDSLKLYHGDVLNFNKSLEGQVDCVWDRGSLVALDRKDVKKYVAVLKDVLKSGGKIFVEVFQYDIAMYEGMPKPPPPHAVMEDELRSLYEPDCTVELVDKNKRMLREKEVDLANYLIVKK